jgi:glucose/arabinose dehydrogenase
MCIGPDGVLYVGGGDAQNPDSAQNPATLNGTCPPDRDKLLRIVPQ